MLLKTWFLLRYLFSIVNLFLFRWFCNTKHLSEILNVKAEMIFEFQNAMNI